MEPDGRDGCFNDDLAEVADEEVDRVEEEQILYKGVVVVDGVEDGGHIHQELGEDGPEVLDVTEEDKEGRKD